MKAAVKQSKVKSGWLNENQLVDLVVFGLEHKDSPGHNFCVATARGLMGLIEPENATAVVTRQTSIMDFME